MGRKRDRGPTDLDNSRIRCRSHNRWKHRVGAVDRRDADGRLVTCRPDGSAMLPVGCRVPVLADDSTVDDPLIDPAIDPAAARCDTLARLLDEIRRVRRAAS